MKELVENFLIIDGVPVNRTNVEIMNYLTNELGYSFYSSRGIMGMAVLKGYMRCIHDNGAGIKTYIA